MKINRNNYEAYFLDYVEGNLDAALINDFIDFLQQNPDLKKELELFETISLSPKDVSFNKKEKLYKEKYDAEKVFNRAAVANLENYISDNEKTDFENYILAHPEKKKDLALFEHTKLQADESIIYRGKKKLYKQPLQKVILFWTGRVAAVLILAFAVFTLVEKNFTKPISENQLAKTENNFTNNEVVVKDKKTTVETEKKDPVKTKKTTTKPAIKKVAPKKKSNKSLREETRGRIEHEDLAIIRIPVEVPNKLQTLSATLPNNRANYSLAPMKNTVPDNIQNIYEERLLADIVKEKTGLKNFNFNKVTKAGLNLVSNFTKDHFTYETNNRGKVTEYIYQSRLVAFSIPTKNLSSNE